MEVARRPYDTGKGDGTAINKLSKALHASQAKIDSLLSELEPLHIELENKTKKFEEKLSRNPA